MKRIIDIPEETYKATCNGSMLPPDVDNVINAIKNSTPLSEELEDIEAEIRYNGLYNEQIECLIDNHIKELKGEIDE